MTIRERIQENRKQVAAEFRKAIAARVAEWAATSAIEDLIGSDVDLQDDVEHLAVVADEKAKTIDVDTLIEAVIASLGDTVDDEVDPNR